MSFNTRSTSCVTYSKTRSSLSAQRSAERTDALLRSPRKLKVSAAKRQLGTPDKKAYSLRNAKSGSVPKVKENTQRVSDQTSSKGKHVTPKKSSPGKLVITLSDNSNESLPEIDLKPQRKTADVVILSSDEDDDKITKPTKVTEEAHEDAATDENEPAHKELRTQKILNIKGIAESVFKSSNIDLTEINLKVEKPSRRNSNQDALSEASISREVREKPLENVLASFKSIVAKPAMSRHDLQAVEVHSPNVTKSPSQNLPKGNIVNLEVKDNPSTFVQNSISETKIIDEVESNDLVSGEEEMTSNLVIAVNTKPSLNVDDQPSVLMSEKQSVHSESFELYDNDNEDTSLASPNVSERPVSSNSRSTTSSSSVTLRENDLYSPGSTDLSMSEDSRGSFVESGSEKTVTRKSRGRLRVKNPPDAKSGGQPKRRSENVSSSCSPSEDGSVEPPSKRSRRLPFRVGITWEIGHRLEAVDHNEWYPAKIVEVDKDACEVLIHFEGWSARFDEWVPMDSPKLRPPSCPNTKTDVKEKKPFKQQYKASEKILARWNDGKFYEATVTEAISEGYYLVVFYDGFMKKLPVSAMRKLNDPTVKKRRLQLLTSPQKKELPVQARSFKERSTGGASHSGRRPASLDSSDPRTAGTVASKQFVVESDHNQFKCTFEGCSKEFRKENLLQSHMKHYHNSEKGSSDISGRSSPVYTKRARARVRSLVLPTMESPSNVEEENKPMSIKLPDLDVSKTQDDEGKSSPVIKLETDPNSSTDSKKQVPADDFVTTTTTALEETCDKIDTKTSEESQQTVCTTKPPEEVKVERVPAAKVLKASPRKEIYPVTKMETRHAKPCLFRDDSIYTGYISYRSLYTKGSRGGRKSGDVESKRGRPGKNDDEKTFPETKRRRRRMSHKTETIKRKSDYPDIDDEIAEMKRRRVDRVSESSVKTDENTWDSVDYDENDDDDETVSDQHEANSDEIVRCICENEEENGLMFQCEECKTWQHAACFNIENEEDVPDMYYCYMCTKPKSHGADASSTKDDSWFTTGVLSTFNFLKVQPSAVNRPNAILATHELVNSTNKVLMILKGLQSKIQIAGSDSHPDLRHWSKPWKQNVNRDKNPPKRAAVLAVPTQVQPQSAPSQPAADAGDFLVFDHAYFSQSDSAIGLQEEVVTEQPEIASNTISLPLSVGAKVHVPDAKQRRSVQVGHEPRERQPSRRRGGHRESGRGRGRWRETFPRAAPVEEIIDIGSCKNNLIGHIHDVQDNMDHELDLIESQLNLLESDANNSGWTGKSELPSVLRSLKSLSKDLDVVQRFTFL